MTRDDAERLNVVFLQMAGLLNQTAAFVRDKDDEVNWHQYRRPVGKAMNAVFDLAELLWVRFPDLKPEQMGGTYKIDPLIYEPTFYDWDDGDAKDEG